MDEIPVCHDDDNEKREYREEVDLSGILPVVADFPAHCWRPPWGSIKSMRRYRYGSRHGSNAEIA
jgi:hypothetical protein